MFSFTVRIISLIVLEIYWKRAFIHLKGLRQTDMLLSILAEKKWKITATRKKHYIIFLGMDSLNWIFSYLAFLQTWQSLKITVLLTSTLVSHRFNKINELFNFVNLSLSALECDHFINQIPEHIILFTSFTHCYLLLMKEELGTHLI